MRRAWRSRVEEPNNSIYSAVSLALRVIFSVSWLWNLFGSFTEPFSCFILKHHTKGYSLPEFPDSYPPHPFLHIITVPILSPHSPSPSRPRKPTKYIPIPTRSHTSSSLCPVPTTVICAAKFSHSMSYDCAVLHYWKPLHWLACKVHSLPSHTVGQLVRRGHQETQLVFLTWKFSSSSLSPF